MPALMISCKNASPSSLPSGAMRGSISRFLLESLLTDVGIWGGLDTIGSYCIFHYYAPNRLLLINAALTSSLQAFFLATSSASSDISPGSIKPLHIFIQAYQGPHPDRCIDRTCMPGFNTLSASSASVSVLYPALGSAHAHPHRG